MNNHSFLVIFFIFTLLILNNRYFSSSPSTKSKPKLSPHPTPNPTFITNPIPTTTTTTTRTTNPIPNTVTQFHLILSFLTGALFASLCIIPIAINFPSFLPNLLHSAPSFSTLPIHRRPTTPHNRHHQPPPASTSTATIPTSNGIATSVLYTLPIFAYSSTRPPKFGKGVTSGCSICLSGFVSDQLLRWLPCCGHFFHCNCIDKWLYSNKTCPCCRTNVEDINSGADEVQTRRGGLVAASPAAGNILPVNFSGPRTVADHHHQAVESRNHRNNNPTRWGEVVAARSDDRDDNKDTNVGYHLVAAARRRVAREDNGSVLRQRRLQRDNAARAAADRQGRLVSITG